MSAPGKIIGPIMLIAGIVLTVAIGAWLWQGTSDGKLDGAAAIFGLVLVLLIITLPLIGGGFYFLIQGLRESSNLEEIKAQRKVLDAVETQGSVSLADLAFELDTNRDSVENSVRALVGRGLFSGYIDWRSGMLYSVEASKLQGSTHCPNCGGKLELVGKGLVKCPYCGAEIFLTG